MVIYNLPVESQYAFLIYRSGTENGIDAAKANLGKVDVTDFNFATSYQVQPYDYDEVERWVKRYTQEVNNMDNFHLHVSSHVQRRHRSTPVEFRKCCRLGEEQALKRFVGNKYANSSAMQAVVPAIPPPFMTQRISFSPRSLLTIVIST